VKPDELFKSLPKSRTLSGATALTDTQKISTVLSYKNKTTRSLVWNIKYKKDQHALTCAGYILYHVLIEIIQENTTWTKNVQQKPYPFIIIPIPISSSRRRERGYNQCELIAKAIVRYDTDEIFAIKTDILFKIKNVKKQTFKNRQERLAGPQGVFTAVMPSNMSTDTLSDIRGRPIFLLDDVITTGSTMQTAIDCLHHAGFKNVRGISLAH
jgi:ComF family protein